MANSFSIVLNIINRTIQEVLDSNKFDYKIAEFKMGFISGIAFVCVNNGEKIDRYNFKNESVDNVVLTSSGLKRSRSKNGRNYSHIVAYIKDNLQ